MSEDQYGQGITSEDIEKAVSMSGYPLQTDIANYLRKNFNVQEEWSYSDSDTGNIRTIDINAAKWLFGTELLTNNQLRVRPILNLLIECKKSELPYIFFLSNSGIFADFPPIYGLRHEEISFKIKNDRSTHNFSIKDSLSLNQHEYASKPEHYCMVFSKCERKSNSIRLSGDMPYNSLILPLYKAVLHFKSTEYPINTAMYFDAHLTIPIAVIDAPLVGVIKEDGEITLNNLSWVRVYRHTYEKSEEDIFRRNKVYGFDIVQRNFFKDYIEKLVIPFSELFSKRILKHQKTIAKGKGFLDVEEIQFYQIEANIRD